MKAEELIIGKWYRNSEEDFLMTKEALRNILDFSDTNNDVYGIPLTEEWLVKFGFEKREDDFYKYPLCIDFIYSNLSVLIYDGRNYFVDSHDKIKYVHQLQNLYFALTGEELSIND